MHELDELTPDACEELLRSARVGRVAVSTPLGPDILTVDVRLLDLSDGPAVVLRTAPYSVFENGSTPTLALEVDDLTDDGGRVVVVRGRARAISDGPTLELIRGAWDDKDGRRRVFWVVERTQMNGRILGTGVS